MERAKQTRTAMNHSRLTTERDSRQLRGAAFVGNHPEAIMQRRLAEAIEHSPQAAVQRALSDGINSSPKMVAQGKQISGMVGDTVQRQAGPGEEELLQGKFDTVQRQGAKDEELQMKRDTRAVSPAQLEANPAPGKHDTGLPDKLKNGIESLSGLSLDAVKIHYNSSQPAQLNALAYAQGTDIHVAPGQEQHLPHETWHVVQQAQGRVKPTMQMKGGVAVNDDQGLEHEADLMGARAASVGVEQVPAIESDQRSSGSTVLGIETDMKDQAIERGMSLNRDHSPNITANSSPQAIQKKAHREIANSNLKPVVQLNQTEYIRNLVERIQKEGLSKSELIAEMDTNPNLSVDARRHLESKVPAEWRPRTHEQYNYVNSKNASAEEYAEYVRTATAKHEAEERAAANAKARHQRGPNAFTGAKHEAAMLGPRFQYP